MPRKLAEIRDRRGALFHVIQNEVQRLRENGCTGRHVTTGSGSKFLAHEC